MTRQLIQELGREPTNEELAERMELSVSKVRKVLRIAQEPISLETLIGDEDESHLGHFIIDAPRLTMRDSQVRHESPLALEPFYLHLLFRSASLCANKLAAR